MKTQLTQEKLEEKAREAIKTAIYTASKTMGHFAQGIWLLKFPPSGQKINIIAMAVEITDEPTMRYAIAHARQLVIDEKPDFTILAGAAYAKGTPEAEMVMAGLDPTTDPSVYAFYAQAPGIDPIALIQRYHRDKDGYVELDGDLKLIKSDKVFVASRIKEQDPWVPPTKEDQELNAKGKYEPLSNGWDSHSPYRKKGVVN